MADALTHGGGGVGGVRGVGMGGHSSLFCFHAFVYVHKQISVIKVTYRSMV